MYVERLRRNLRPVIESHGFRIVSNTHVLDSISVRQIWNIERGISVPNVQTLEAIADEIGADFLDFFRE
jgi:transcriptional regulator with XRE-family HTH domain